MGSEPSDARSIDSKVRSTVLRTPLHNTIPQFAHFICVNVFHHPCKNQIDQISVSI
ncbi:hypothetical protein RHMOL_Rhmol06G0068700 [Rhododendron molle]|nr:hypothetical protein RHMOL_Rhmol06G0068700 [Rhododendron molle]